MRIWLAGSRSFGVAVYEELCQTDGMEVVAVTTRQDDVLAQVHKTLVCDEVFPRWVERYGVDVILSAQNYTHISREAREAARLGAIGYHPSLLPRHRGRSAVEWTVAMRDPIAGGTVYQMDDGWDTGPIIAQDFCHVHPDWTASDLWRERLFGMGVELIGKALQKVGSGGWTPESQDEAFATVEPRWAKDESTQQQLARLVANTGSALGAY